MRQFDLEKIGKEAEPILKPEKPAKNSFWPYLLGAALGVLAMLAFTQTQSSLLKKKTTGESQAVEQLEEKSVPTSPLAKEVKTPTPAQESPVKETTGSTLDKSKITLRISNGNGIKGDAAKVKALLEKEGFKVTSVGNASSFNYQTTIVYYKEDKEEAGRAVEEVLKKNGRTTSLEKSESLIQYDVLVVVGKK